MTDDRLVHEFTAPLWVWDARPTETWTMVSLPEDAADDVLDAAGAHARGFGSLRVEATIGTTTWRTSIFPGDSTYVLPVKRAVRTAEGLAPGQSVRVRVRVLVP